ncbi:MAG: hypothetical protein J5J00_11990 [Deltaproteobacteria bacterium]|nr:hypothetical protein [Deltaproteobacteria bacterium]
MYSTLKTTFISLATIAIVATPAQAARVKGKVTGDSPQNYKVVAVNKNASSTVAAVKANGSFSVNAKKNATLHLVSTSGKYVGPIGAAKGSKFYANLSGEKGNIGKVTLGNGFATTKYNGKTRKYYARKKVSFDSSTGPLGAGKFGLVLNPVGADALAKRAKKVGVRAEDDELGEDLDSDGIPDLLDIDDDGDLELDIVDEVQHAQTDFNAEIASTLRLELSNSLNINVGSPTDSQVDSLIQSNLFLLMLLQNNSNGATVSSVNVDCGSLSYCSSSGTAIIQMDNPPITNGSVWSDYDPEGDGFPNLFVTEGRMPEINIKPQATRSQIGTGDTIFFRINTSNGNQILPAVLPFVFSTAPALKEYSSGGSNPVTISYPVDASLGSGTSGNPIVLGAQQVTLTFWKPQRSAIDGAETPGYIDMGGLNYGVYLSPQGSTSVLTCELSDYSNLSSTLQTLSAVNGAQAMVDTAADVTASASNTLTFTLDIGACLTRQGVSTTGTTVMMDLVATSQAQDQTSQSIHFKLPG